MRRIGFVLLAVIASAGVVPTTHASNEPDGFRGVPWGTSEDALREKLGETSAHGVLWDRCGLFTNANRWIGDRFCAGAFPLAGVRMDAVYTFRRDRFTGVDMTFPSNDFETVAAIFRERFGAPTTAKEEVFTTKGGLKATNRIDEWIGPTIVIAIRQFGATIDQGPAALGLKSDRQEALRLRREQTEGAAKGL
jgi:hypothetical protein